MDIQRFKKQLKEKKPFVVFKFQGVDNGLMEDGLPLNVSLNPPKISFIVESPIMSTIILRYSDTYTKRRDKVKNTKDSAVAQKIVNEVTTKLRGDDAEKLKMIGAMVTLGKEYLIGQSVRAWHRDDGKESVKIYFTEDSNEADEFNDSHDTEVMIWTGSLKETELLNVAMELTSAIPTDSIPNIPMVDTTAPDKGGETETTVPAEKVAKFSRNLRNIPVEDVRADDSGEDRYPTSDITT